MLDASFDAQNSRISEISALVETIRRPDGALINGIVTRDSLSPEIYGDLRFEMALSAAEERRKAENVADLARQAAENAENSQKQAEKSEISARADAFTVSTAKSDQIRQIQPLIRQAEALLHQLRQAQAQLDTTESYAGHSEAWAYSSQLWAEHMPDTLPDNALKMMDITGDHWSARWWANRLTTPLAG